MLYPLVNTFFLFKFKSNMQDKCLFFVKLFLDRFFINYFF